MRAGRIAWELAFCRIVPVCHRIVFEWPSPEGSPKSIGCVGTSSGKTPTPADRTSRMALEDARLCLAISTVPFEVFFSPSSSSCFFFFIHCFCFWQALSTGIWLLYSVLRFETSALPTMQIKLGQAGHTNRAILCAEGTAYFVKSFQSCSGVTLLGCLGLASVPV